MIANNFCVECHLFADDPGAMESHLQFCIAYEDFTKNVLDAIWEQEEKQILKALRT